MHWEGVFRILSDRSRYIGIDEFAPDRVLLGIAVWSRYDLELLDRIEATLTETTSFAMYVFDVDECHGGAADFERYVPGLGKVYHTPIVGIWRNGVLTSRASGFKGRQLFAETALLE